MKQKKTRNWYEELDREVKIQEGNGYKFHDIHWVCDRIDWCWQFRKITEEQMEELVDRVCEVMDSEVHYLKLKKSY